MAALLKYNGKAQKQAGLVVVTMPYGFVVEISAKRGTVAVKHRGRTSHIHGIPFDLMPVHRLMNEVGQTANVMLRTLVAEGYQIRRHDQSLIQVDCRNNVVVEISITAQLLVVYKRFSNAEARAARFGKFSPQDLLEMVEQMRAG